ncbi:DegV family protein [Bacillus sp. 31A1R]|uniref:DegV family protein n=1 Tax=Robertmurraya mangrovi TaxID=3098077 RepID=A0ABU5J030_9BACI|nr:DegV family protein [Bacillus sp. 31A1R]MDZ5472768.1 DegV family protein [Bacillus sp. 31A1R]
MTKKKIAWVTDSTAFITEELKNHPDVYVVPLGITFDDATFLDGVDLDTEELYDRINTQKEIPKTSQPSVGTFAELYENLRTNYESAVAIHVSSKLSGTMSSSISGGDMAGMALEVVDSKSMSFAITTLIHIGLELEKQGKDYKEIANVLRAEADKNQNYILLGNLDQFYKGGRMSGTQYLLGSILKIKPIIRINPEGAFELFDKVRSEKKAVKRLIELLGEAYERNTIKQVEIMHGKVLNKAKELEQEVLAVYPNLKIVIGEISSTIAAHAGEGTVAILWHNE